MKNFAILFVILVLVNQLVAQTPDKTGFDAARQQYEEGSHDETARLGYVTQLAKIADKLVTSYRQSGERNDDLTGAINAELQKHPAPKNVDAKKLSLLLVGKWASPRHIYVFRANGKYGNEDGPVNSNWRIKGNQLIEDGSHGTIILLNSDYFIYANGDSVFFHSRVN